MKIKHARATNIQCCSVIHFLVLENVVPNEIHRCVIAAYGSEVMFVQAVRKWYHQFENGKTSVFNEERAGRSVSVLTNKQWKKTDAIRNKSHIPI